ncbi:agglutinin-2 [Quercus suber]|uniref:Agglutinin-2 n=1 Tax=Quercus suber TaxID=58331 RepID=A0AAW0KKH3_QUESU
MDSQYLYSLPLLFVFFFCCFPYTTSMISFSFPNFLPNDNNITVSGTASKAQVDGHRSIRLTDNVDSSGGSVGRAYYYKPIPLWDSVANDTTNFTTTFEFVIRTRGPSSRSRFGGGIAFFITSKDSVDAPINSGGGRMGLFNRITDGKSSSQMVAGEFDTWLDTLWRDDPSDNHVGIDVNSLVSKVSGAWNLTAGDILVATISYDGTSDILSVFLKYLNLPNLPLNLTHNVKLRDVLPEEVMMGFSAATGGGVPVQAIRSWNFSSTLDLGSTQNGGKGNSKMWLVGLITGLVLFIAGVSFGTYILWRNSKRKKVEEDEDLIEGTGPKIIWITLISMRNGSNVMLDSNFNAKLGDFGLARFVDHGLGSRTTNLAGIMGYIAPECLITSKFSKESDVFSFGVVELGIACGRKVVEPKAGESKISLLNWVWELYGEERL